MLVSHHDGAEGDDDDAYIRTLDAVLLLVAEVVMLMLGRCPFSVNRPNGDLWGNPPNIFTNLNCKVHGSVGKNPEPCQYGVCGQAQKSSVLSCGGHEVSKRCGGRYWN